MGADRDGDSPIGDPDHVALAVIDTISSATGTDPCELPPLSDAIDPDALNALFSDRTTNGWVRFRYAGYDVTVGSDRSIRITAES